MLYTKKIIEAVRQSLQAKREFENAILSLKKLTPPKTNLLFYQKGLEYFRNKFSQYPIEYYGDVYFSELFISGVKFGLSVEETYNNTIELIDSEFEILKNHIANGLEYDMNFDFTNSKVYLSIFYSQKKN